MMTRKDYQAIAHVINNNRIDFEEGEDGYVVLNLVSHHLAHYMAQDNPNFDRAKFLTACGVN